MVNRSYGYGLSKLARLPIQIRRLCGKEDLGANLKNPKSLWGVLLSTLLLSAIAVAQESSHLFDVPQQSADGALTMLADQADVSVAFDFEIVSQYQANRLVGVYTLTDAVALMLDGTDLKFEFGDSDHLIITKNSFSNESTTMGNSTNNNVIAAVLGFLVGTTGAQQVVAQDTGARTLEEIVVTARKREESLADVPVAISAFTEQGLEDAAIDDLDELLNATAGTVYSDTNGNRATASPGIRGIRGGGTGGSTRISTFVDGMPMIGSQASINLVDVEAVEIYRGPQSAVFGRSVFAGAINYTTRTPSLTDMEGGLNSQYGSDARAAVNGWVSAPIVEGVLAASISAARDSYGGPGEIKSSDGYDMGIRDTEYYSVALAFEPTDNISANLRYTATMLDDGPAADYNLDPALHPEDYVAAAANFDAMGNRIPGSNFAPMFFGEINLEDDPVLARNFCYNFGLPDQNCILDPGWEMDRTRLTFDINYEFENGGNLEFKTFSSDDVLFDHDDQDNTDEYLPVAMVLVNMGTDTEIEEKYYEVVWTSPDEDRLRYTLGYSQYEYDYYNAAYFIHPAAQNDQGTPNIPGITTQTVLNHGVFGGLFYDVNDQMTVSFEARQQHDDISSLDPDPTDDNVPEAITDTFLPRVSLTYAATDSMNLYVQYAEGAQPAQVNNQAVGTIQRAVAAAMDGLNVNGTILSSAIPFLDSIVAVDEEKIKNYEVGMKGQFLDNQLSLNAALFLIETDSYVDGGNLWFFDPRVSINDTIAAMLATSTDPVILNSNLQDTSFRAQGGINAGNLRSTGLELEAVYLLNDNWTLGGQFTYLDTIFDEGCSFDGQTFGIADSTLLPPGSSEPIDCTIISGNKFTYVPEIQIGASATYEADLSNGMSWFARLDGRYEDEQFVDDFNNGYLGASLKLNVRAGINLNNVRIEGYIENLTDDNTPAGAQYEPDRKQVQHYFNNRPPAGSTGINVAIATLVRSECGLAWISKRGRLVRV